MRQPSERVIFEAIGWWDAFNCVLYAEEKDALAAIKGGNDVFKVYRLKLEANKP